MFGTFKSLSCLPWRRTAPEEHKSPDGAPDTPTHMHTTEIATTTSERHEIDDQQPCSNGSGTQTLPAPITPEKQTTNHGQSRAEKFLSDFAEGLRRRIAGDSSGADPPGEESVTLHPEATDSDNTPNVIIFGETGVGKSSLINMVSDTASAAVSNAAIGCTFESVPYDVELSGCKYRLWDTAGLNEGEHGNVTADRAIENLRVLVQGLKDGGVGLLVYCIRGSRLRDIVKINYDLFYKVICGGEVPIVVAITGLENEEDMENWWKDNAEDFDRQGMNFSGHACITATKGKVTTSGQYMFEEEYNLSVKLVQEVIVAHCGKGSWTPDGSGWLRNIADNMGQMHAESGIGILAQDHGQCWGSS